MPSRPPRPCARPGCTALTTTAYCPAHTEARRQERDLYRGSARARGYDHHWEAARRWYLAGHPLCERCESAGRVTPAVLVHHIVPVEQSPALRLAVENLQALCRDCHEELHGRRHGPTA